MGSRDLPAPVRAWAAVARAGNFRGRARIGTSLVQRVIRPEVVYRNPEGFKLRVEPDDYFQACMLLGIYDPVTAGLIDRFVSDGTVAFDIGAHIGYFTLMLARRVGSAGDVHAFDPDPRAASRLREHVRVNEADNVTVNQMAVSDVEGMLDLRVPDQLGWATVKPGVVAHATVSAPAVRIDDYVNDNAIDPSRVSFVKIDAEGAELDAIRGMEGALARMSGAVVVEFFPSRMRTHGDDPDQLLATMAGLGYRALVARRGRSGLTTAPASPQHEGDLLFLKPN